MSDSLRYQRKKAVDGAWKRERQLVSQGKGTRNWTKKEQKELIQTGRVKGYEGHHMKNVADHHSKAGDSSNIQFLTRKEHFAAHRYDFHNKTNGYYDPLTGKTTKGKSTVKPRQLSNPLSESARKKAIANGVKNDQAKLQKQREYAKNWRARQVNKEKSSSNKTSKKMAANQSPKTNTAAFDPAKASGSHPQKGRAPRNQSFDPHKATKPSSGQSKSPTKGGRTSAGKKATSGKGRTS